MSGREHKKHWLPYPIIFILVSRQIFQEHKHFSCFALTSGEASSSQDHASYMLISPFSDENILLSCPDFCFTNSDFSLVSDFISEISITNFTSSHLCVSSLKPHFSLQSLSIDDFANRAILFLFAEAITSRPFPPHMKK